jgi:hypothetical protein
MRMSLQLQTPATFIPNHTQWYYVAHGKAGSYAYVDMMIRRRIHAPAREGIRFPTFSFTPSRVCNSGPIWHHFPMHNTISVSEPPPPCMSYNPVVIITVRVVLWGTLWGRRNSWISSMFPLKYGLRLKNDIVQHKTNRWQLRSLKLLLGLGWG